ncbi:1-phosphofructokinase family hexose kinase [Nocardioides sp. GY 10113]|uniref:1-phosphofructokinase family hexose kinase n=1 Tax=Nocardioides sp. GY 10113 TaxID=2569761 RepID=UPI0010A88D87|nr:1-phosphofructokinase family hexose kinase [Nocardioides sp. GY 10113]TIC88724.1 1-phosphofructokinase family hexose kinase [Nocardioides sp. GY 10113]
MILTLTPNPSIDRTVSLDAPLCRGQVQRVTAVTAQAGGKGVNISRAAAVAGIPSVAVVPAEPDDPFVLELRAAGIQCHPVEPAGDVRVNLTITEPDGTTTKLNSPGAEVDAEHLEVMAAAVLERAAEASWAVLAGSLPAGAPAGFYADLVARLRGHGARVAVDTSEAPLKALVDAMPAAAPDLMKPNGEELASVLGGDPEVLESDPVAAAAAARELLARGVGAVLATLGGNGAVLVTPEGAWHASPPPTTVVSTVGAGDCSLFGYLLGDVSGLPAPDRLALAVAYGSAAASLPGTTIPASDQLQTDLVGVTALGGNT